MSLENFDFFPSVEVLQELVEPASLINHIDNLSKAVRIWVILRKLYALNPEFEKENFTYLQWRNFLFIDAKNSHSKDRKPSHNDSQCICSKTIKELLFQPNDAEEQWQNWQTSFTNKYQRLISNSELHSLLDDIEQVKPFYVTGKTIDNDLLYLTKKQYLEKVLNSKKRTYSKVKFLPELKNNNHNNQQPEKYDEYKFPFLLDDFGFMAESLAKPVNNVQRFYIHPDYKTLNIDNFKNIITIVQQLKAIWELNSLTPITINYHSASLSQFNFPAISKCNIYPICVYFYQKAFYLCGFGQTPREKEQGNWYNYRLDRIKSLEELESDTLRLPEYLQQFNEQSGWEDDANFIMQNHIDRIQDSLQEAYGFDYYREDAEMILCFPPNFNHYYNRNTFRHETFKEQTYQQVKRKIVTADITKEQKQLLKNKLEKYHQQEYGYYKLQYRIGDYSVLRRIRDWSHNVEVLLPWQLRQQIRQDIEANWNRYKDDF